MTAAAAGMQGLEIILRESPDVALVDIGLPGINGYEVARRVKAGASQSLTLLVAVTGYGREVDRSEVFAAGFNEHLVKPVDPQELAKVLRKAP